jgi:hypothetical protein
MATTQQSREQLLRMARKNLRGQVFIDFAVMSLTQYRLRESVMGRCYQT